MLPSYLFLCATHLQRSLSCFTHNTLIETAILNLGHSYMYIPTCNNETYNTHITWVHKQDLIWLQESHLCIVGSIKNDKIESTVV